MLGSDFMDYSEGKPADSLIAPSMHPRLVHDPFLRKNRFLKSHYFIITSVASSLNIQSPIDG
jgi:hypothetical protein